MPSRLSKPGRWHDRYGTESVPVDPQHGKNRSGCALYALSSTWVPPVFWYLQVIEVPVGSHSLSRGRAPDVGPAGPAAFFEELEQAWCAREGLDEGSVEQSSEVVADRLLLDSFGLRCC
jgi:hypothetical protein